MYGFCVCVCSSQDLLNGPLFIKVSFKAREIKTTYFNTTHMALFKLLIFRFFTFYTRNVIQLLTEVTLCNVIPPKFACALLNLNLNYILKHVF